MRHRAAVAHDLHLDMAGPAHQPFDKKIAVAKPSCRFRTGTGEGLFQVAVVEHRAHAPAATARHCLDHHRAVLAEIGQKGTRLFQAARRVGRRQHRHLLFHRQLPRGMFVAKQRQRFRRRPDEGQPGCRAGTGKIRILRKETVTGMHRRRTALLGGCDNGVAVEIRRDPAPRQ